LRQSSTAFAAAFSSEFGGDDFICAKNKTERRGVGIQLTLRPDREWMDNTGFGCFHGSRKRDRAARPAAGDGKCFPFLAMLDQSLEERDDNRPH
jgi:hypothetical protein